jgi:hypothetical protein
MSVPASEQALWDHFCSLSKASRHYRPINEPAIARAYWAWLASLGEPAPQFHARPPNVIQFPGARA